MHDRLTEIAGEEVVGEVRRVGDTFFDVGFGRICLPVLDRDRVAEIVARLQQSFGRDLQVNDRLNLDERGQLIRGRVDATIRTEGSAPYLLQITGPNVVAFYELRFKIDDATPGDLAGALSGGLARILGGQSEGPLRLLSGYDKLQRTYLERLDAAVRADVAGADCDARRQVAELLEPLRTAWRFVPWPLRDGVQLASRVGSDRIVPHDRQLRRTLLFATNLVDGKLVYQYVHQHNPLEEYEQVLGWMSEIYTAMADSYPPPTYAAAMARASSAETFVRHFPSFERMVI
jgi:hypothetical protein